MPIQRFAPGEPAPHPGTYALVDHYGEALNVSVRVNSGQQLPFVVVTGVNPVWFVQIGTTASNSQAA